MQGDPSGRIAGPWVDFDLGHSSGRPIGIFTYISYTYIGEIKNDTLGLNLKATDTPKISETPIIPDTGIFGRKKAQFLSPLGAESVYFGRKCLFRPK